MDPLREVNEYEKSLNNYKIHSLIDDDMPSYTTILTQASDASLETSRCLRVDELRETFQAQH